ncbi:MAG: TolC family protein, partial [Gammaproteobacteria bacterium]
MGLPDHLTLAEALALADGPHPDLTVAKADVQAARAERTAADANMGLNASVDARGMWVDPSPVAPYQSHNDSSVSVLLTKRLYDFGHTSALRSAADATTRGSELQYMDARNRHRVDVVARYFDVLLADLKFAVTDQAMAVAYVTFDRVRDRHKLKQVSDVALLESQNAYEKARTARYAAQ